MIYEYFRARVTHANYGTHVSSSPVYHMLIADDARSQDELSRHVYYANRNNRPVTIREHLTARFAMHLTLAIIGRNISEQVLQDVMVSLGKRLVVYIPGMSAGIDAVFFKASVSGGLRGQVVFPDVIVNSDRARQLRRMLIEDIMRLEPALEHILTCYDVANKLFTVVEEIETCYGVVLPLCDTGPRSLAWAGTQSQPLTSTDTALNPLGWAKLTESGLTPLPPLDDNWNWVWLALKRRAGTPELTDLRRPGRLPLRRDSGGIAGRVACRAARRGYGLSTTDSGGPVVRNTAGRRCWAGGDAGVDATGLHR